MNKNRIIEFDPKEHILQKAKTYVDSLELFLDERGRAIPLLLKALKYASRDLKLEIIFLLGSFAKEEIGVSSPLSVVRFQERETQNLNTET